MDAIFAKADGWKGWLTVVHQARVEPRWYGNNGELLVDLEQMKVHQNVRGGGVQEVEDAQGPPLPQLKASEEQESSSRDDEVAHEGGEGKRLGI